MAKTNAVARPATACPPLRKTVSSPSVTPSAAAEPDTFTEELQLQAAVARDSDTGVVSERWMHVVMRRETLQQAVGRIVHVERIGGSIKSTPQ